MSFSLRVLPSPATVRRFFVRPSPNHPAGVVAVCEDTYNDPANYYRIVVDGVLSLDDAQFMCDALNTVSVNGGLLNARD